jgi:hypothetical protein
MITVSDKTESATAVKTSFHLSPRNQASARVTKLITVATFERAVSGIILTLRIVLRAHDRGHTNRPIEKDEGFSA